METPAFLVYRKVQNAVAKIGGYADIVGMATLSLFDDVPEASSGWDFRTILLADDNWERYQSERADQLRPVEFEEVTKMLACCDPRAGFVTLLCLKCGAEKRLPLTCKSRLSARQAGLCARCGLSAARQGNATRMNGVSVWDLRCRRYRIGI